MAITLEQALEKSRLCAEQKKKNAIAYREKTVQFEIKRVEKQLGENLKAETLEYAWNDSILDSIFEALKSEFEPDGWQVYIYEDPCPTWYYKKIIVKWPEPESDSEPEPKKQGFFARLFKWG